MNATGRARSLCFGVAVLLLPSVTTPTPAPAQGPGWPSCPRPLVVSPWSASESRTRAVLAQKWFEILTQRVPGSRRPDVLMTLAPNEPVSLCRIPSNGSATEGLGGAADVAVVIVSASATEEIVRFESAQFEVYLPPSSGAEATAESTLGELGPDWPLLAVPVTPKTGEAMFRSLLSNSFANEYEVIAFANRVPDQPGLARREQLVMSDRCGRIALDVGLQNSVVRVFSGVIVPPSCEGGRTRALLTRSPRYAVTERALTFTVGDTTVTFSRSPSPRGKLRSVRNVKSSRVNLPQTPHHPRFVCRGPTRCQCRCSYVGLRSRVLHRKPDV
jgi:hypothetical protein